MKRYILAVGLLLVFSTGFAQLDYCPVINKAIKAGADNFSTYTNFQYNTVGGQKAYLADFTFVIGENGYVYYYPSTQKMEFFQKITTDQSKYQEIYKSIESCLVKDDNYWTKLDGTAADPSAIFSCDKTGCEVTLVTNKDGVTVIVKRNKNKDIPVFTTAFCASLKYLVTELGTNFKNTTGAFVDSSVIGKSYKSTQQLNGRGVASRITVHASWSNPKVIEYDYSEMVSGADMDPATVITYFDQCLTEADGWKKGKPSYGDGILYTKGDIEVQLSTSKSFSYKEADNTHISIQKALKF